MKAGKTSEPVCQTNPGRRPDVNPWSQESTPSEMYLPVVRGGSSQRLTHTNPTPVVRSMLLEAAGSEPVRQSGVYPLARIRPVRLALHAAARGACEALRDARGSSRPTPYNGPAWHAGSGQPQGAPADSEV